MAVDGKMLLKGFELLTTSATRKAKKNDFDSIRSSIIDSIISSLSERFESDDTLMQTIEPFFNFDKNADIRKIHELFAADLDLSLLSLQFNEMVDHNEPHSSDVERCISANNLIKTPLRNSLLIKTEIKYLYVYFNMPTLESWNPRPAIKLWMDKKQRKDYSNVIERKATNAEHFKGIFNAAHEDQATNTNEQKKNLKSF